MWRRVLSDYKCQLSGIEGMKCVMEDSFVDGDGYFIVPVQANHVAITAIVWSAFKMVAHCSVTHHFPNVGFVMDAVALLADPQLLARLGVAAWDQSVEPLLVGVDP